MMYPAIIVVVVTAMVVKMVINKLHASWDQIDSWVLTLLSPGLSVLYQRVSMEFCASPVCVIRHQDEATSVYDK